MILVLSLEALCSSALSKHYHIVPINSTDSACQDYQNGTCLTLDQLAQSDLSSAGGTNLTLSFLPGEHLLTQSLAIHNFTHVQMNGTNGSIVCFHRKLKIEMAQSDKLIIENLDFIQNLITVSSNKQQGLQFEVFTLTIATIRVLTISHSMVSMITTLVQLRLAVRGTPPLSMSHLMVTTAVC